MVFNFERIWSEHLLTNNWFDRLFSQVISPRFNVLEGVMVMVMVMEGGED